MGGMQYIRISKNKGPRALQGEVMRGKILNTRDWPKGKYGWDVAGGDHCCIEVMEDSVMFSRHHNGEDFGFEMMQGEPTEEDFAALKAYESYRRV